MIYVWLLILLPLAGSLWIAFGGRRLGEQGVAKVACGAALAAFGVAFLAFCQVLLWRTFRGDNLMPVVRWDGLWPGLSWGQATQVLVPGPTWIQAGNLRVTMELLLDPVSVTMALVVTGVGSLIHLYSRGYMHGDPHFPRFFALLNLFLAAMLILVLGNNMAFMFVGWEGVGFCSYMLIGYYTERVSASNAGKKAFIVNRIGDLGLLLAMFLVFKYFGSLEFSQISLHAPKVLGGHGEIAIAIALLAFVGAVGKSAQFPLYVWLPDAMEGPTPVSALIHAATMVTAGVYLVIRLGVVYALAPAALAVVAAVGLLTAIMAALVAVVQTDIKKVLAYSTVSQLGLMFLGAGVGAYGAALFHLVTHAFFKGLLFLGSGSVIHAVEHALHGAGEHKDPQDMRHMGGLARKMPTTYWTMLIGTMAIAGVPGLAGFFSKDEILHFAGHRSSLYLVGGLLVSFLTAFYMFRLIYKTFLQETRLSDAAYEHLHESPPVLTQPLVVLAGLSLLGGLLNLPFGGILSHWLDRWIYPLVHRVEPLLWGEHGPPHEGVLAGMLLATVVAGVAILLSYLAYRSRATDRDGWLERKTGGVYRTLTGLYYLDETYRAFIVNPGHRLAEWLAGAFDQGVIDGAVNGTAGIFGILSEWFRRYQVGIVRSYALWFAVGAATMVALAVVGTGSPWLLTAVALAVVVALVIGAAMAVQPGDEAGAAEPDDAGSGGEV